MNGEDINMCECGAHITSLQCLNDCRVSFIDSYSLIYIEKKVKSGGEREREEILHLSIQ